HAQQSSNQKYAQKNGCTEETAANFLALAKQNRSRVPFYQTMQDEDREETGEDVSRDDHWDYAEILWNGIQAEAVREAFEKLNYRAQTLLEKRNDICMTCGRVSPSSTRLTFEELAILFEGSTASGAERAYRKAVEHLEHLTKPKSDQSGSKGEKSQMDISPAFISDEQAPVSMEPGKGSLNNPAVLSKMRGTVHPTSGNAVLYMSHCARLSAKRKIVPFISVKFLRMTSGSPVQISQGWQMIQHIFQHFAIIHIGGSEADNKRNAIAIRYEMMFTSRTTSIYGVGS